MTDATTLLALAIGCILGALVVAVIYETSHRRHQRRATGPRTASHVEPEYQSTPELPEPPEADYPGGWMPLSRMSREEVEAHLARLDEVSAELAEHGWPRSRGGFTDPTVRTVDLTPPEEER